MICCEPWECLFPVNLALSLAFALRCIRYPDRLSLHKGQAGAVSKAWSNVRARQGRHSTCPHISVVGS